jgi:preprotein translocase subunit SecD
MVVRDLIEYRVRSLSIGQASVEINGTDRIIVALPGGQDTAAIRAAISRTGRLDFVPLAVGDREPAAGSPIDLTVARPLFSGDQLMSAASEPPPGGIGDVRLTLSLKQAGSDLLAVRTASHPGEALIISLDAIVLGVVRPPAGTGDQLTVPVALTQAQADDVIVVLRHGSLPFPVTEVSASVVGAGPTAVSTAAVRTPAFVFGPAAARD